MIQILAKMMGSAALWAPQALPVPVQKGIQGHTVRILTTVPQARATMEALAQMDPHLLNAPALKTPFCLIVRYHLIHALPTHVRMVAHVKMVSGVSRALVRQVTRGMTVQ